MALNGRRMMQIFQTVTVRLDDGKKGPPSSYSEEEKACYLEFEKEITESEKKGQIANFSFPDDCDWEDGSGDLDYASFNR